MSYKISEGVYGCVYIPPLMCSSGTTLRPTMPGDRVVSKIQKNVYSKQEITLVEKIRQLPLASHYFLLPEPTICHLNSSQKNLLQKTCEAAEDVPFERMTQIQIPYGGQSMRSAKINFKTFSFKRYMRHFLEGIALLKKHNYLHADLHMGNVLLSEAGLPMFIDFAKLTSFTETSEQIYKTRFLAFESGHEQIPAECLLMAGLHLTPKTAEQIIDVIPNMIDISYLSANFLNYTREEQQQDLREFLQRFKQENPTKFLDLQTFWYTISPKFDCYSAGVIFLKLLRNFLRSPYFAERQYSIGKDSIEKVIRGLISFNPYTRLSAEEALKILNNS